MKGFIDIAKEVGPFGAIGLLLIAAVIAGGADLTLENILKLTAPTTTNQGASINRILLIFGAVLLIAQFIFTAQNTMTKRDLEGKRNEVDVKQTDFQRAEEKAASSQMIRDLQTRIEDLGRQLTDAKSRLAGDQAIVVQREKELRAILHLLTSHRALSNDDDPRFVSRVVKSADRLREEIGDLLQSQQLLDVSQEILLYFRWATAAFVSSVEHIEYESKLNLHDADFSIESLDQKHQFYFRNAHNEWRHNVQVLLRGIAYGKGSPNFESF